MWLTAWAHQRTHGGRPGQPPIRPMVIPTPKRAHCPSLDLAKQHRWVERDLIVHHVVAGGASLWEETFAPLLLSVCSTATADNRRAANKHFPGAERFRSPDQPFSPRCPGIWKSHAPAQANLDFVCLVICASRLPRFRDIASRLRNCHVGVFRW